MIRITRLGRIERIGISMLLVLLIAVTTFALSTRHPQAVAAPRTNFSAIPQGLADYQGLHAVTAPRTNFSAIPQGLADYQGLHTAAPSTNFSHIPQGLADYQGLHTAAPSTNFSHIPQGLADYLH